MTPILAWHFGPADGRLGHGDGRPIVVGETLRHEGPLVCCRSGLHASERLTDALRYARSWRLYRVRYGGETVRGDDKLVCRERTALWEVDARVPVLTWAADCAERALRRERAAGREPDARSWAAIEAVRAHLRGESVDLGDAAAAAAAYAADAAYAGAAHAAYAAHAADAAAERRWQHRRLIALVSRARRAA